MRNTIAILTLVATMILFGYAGSILLATETGRAVIGASAALFMIAALAAAARALLPPDRSAY
jgi:hypothetical protein